MQIRSARARSHCCQLGASAQGVFPHVTSRIALIMNHWFKRAPHPRFIRTPLSTTSTFAGNLTLFGGMVNVISAQGAQPQCVKYVIAQSLLSKTPHASIG